MKVADMGLVEEILAIEEGLRAYFLGLVAVYGGMGVLVAMFLESSVLPVPSELILIGAGLLGIPPLEVAIYGGIGSTLGAIVGYYIGKLGGRPVIDRYGKYMLISRKSVDEMEGKIRRQGTWFVFIARLIPIIPFKVFSIASGIMKVELKGFIGYTLVGTLIRAYVLALMGHAIFEYQEKALMAIAIIIVIIWLADKRFNFGRRLRKKGRRKKRGGRKRGAGAGR